MSDDMQHGVVFDTNAVRRVRIRGTVTTILTTGIQHKLRKSPELTFAMAAAGTVGNKLNLFNLVGGEYRMGGNPDGMTIAEWARDDMALNAVVLNAIMTAENEPPMFTVDMFDTLKMYAMDRTRSVVIGLVDNEHTDNDAISYVLEMSDNVMHGRLNGEKLEYYQLETGVPLTYSEKHPLVIHPAF